VCVELERPEKEGGGSAVEKGKEGFNVSDDMVVDGRKDGEYYGVGKVLKETEGKVGEKEGQGVSMHGHLDRTVGMEPPALVTVGEKASKELGKENEVKGGRHFKRRNRPGKQSEEKLGVDVGGKRGGEHMEVDVEDVENNKKQKGADGSAKTLMLNAGLSEQLREAQ
jgi:hypothetical protein